MSDSTFGTLRLSPSWYRIHQLSNPFVVLYNYQVTPFLRQIYSLTMLTVQYKTMSMCPPE